MGILDALKTLAGEMNRLQKQSPAALGEIAVTLFHDNFTQQGFMDEELTPWENRKSKKDTDRAILILRGRLRRSVRVTRKSIQEVVIGSDVPYAKVHNEGGQIQVSGHARKSKKGNQFPVRGYMYLAKRRQFMGTSKKLDQQVQNYFSEQFNIIKNKIDA